MRVLSLQRGPSYPPGLYPSRRNPGGAGRLGRRGAPDQERSRRTLMQIPWAAGESFIVVRPTARQSGEIASEPARRAARRPRWTLATKTRLTQERAESPFADLLIAGREALRSIEVRWSAIPRLPDVSRCRAASMTFPRNRGRCTCAWTPGAKRPSGRSSRLSRGARAVAFERSEHLTEAADHRAADPLHPAQRAERPGPAQRYIPGRRRGGRRGAGMAAPCELQRGRLPGEAESDTGPTWRRRAPPQERDCEYLHTATPAKDTAGNTTIEAYTYI